MKPRDVKIRRAQPSDFEKVAQMHYPVWRQSWIGIIEDFVIDLIATPKFWATVSYPEVLSRLGSSMWIAESGGAILGMTIFGPDPGNANDVQIEALYTADVAPARGIGVRLLNKAIRANPSGDVILWCAEKNSKARQFYERNGFHADGRTYNWEPLRGVSVPHVGYRRHPTESPG